MPKPTDLSPEGVVGAAFLSMPFGALTGVISGSLGKLGLSFFSSSMASAAGTAATFAGVGLIAAPLTIIPMYITNKLLANSEFQRNRPKLAKFLADTATFLITLGAVAASATLLGASWPATIMAMMVIPTIVYALKTLCNVINACFDACKAPESNISCAM